MENNAKIRVLLADDQKELVKEIASVLSSDDGIEVVGIDVDRNIGLDDHITCGVRLGLLSGHFILNGDRKHGESRVTVEQVRISRVENGFELFFRNGELIRFGIESELRKNI